MTSDIESRRMFRCVVISFRIIHTHTYIYIHIIINFCHLNTHKKQETFNFVNLKNCEKISKEIS